MRLFEHRTDGGWLIDAIRRQRAEEAPRTGLHVSTICDDIAKTLEPRKYAKSNFTETQMLVFQELGNAVEDVVAKALAARYMGFLKPEPRQDADGIWGSPDGWHAPSRTIHEIKATWVSPRGFVEISKSGKLLTESYKFYRYRIQAMKYGAADMWDAARIMFHVVFMVGTGYPPLPTPPRTLTLVPTEAEFASNAAMLKQHAQDRQWL